MTYCTRNNTTQCMHACIPLPSQIGIEITKIIKRIPIRHPRGTPSLDISRHIGISLHLILAIQPRYNLLQESLLLIRSARSLDVIHPDGDILLGSDLGCFGDGILEAGDLVGAGGFVEPVQGDESDGALGACVEEALQPREVLGVLQGAGGADGDALFGVGLHLVHEELGALLWVHVELVIWSAGLAE